MVKLLYRDFPKLRNYYRDQIWEMHVGPDFNAWVRNEFNCQVRLGQCRTAQDEDEDEDDLEWYMTFANDTDATAFALKWA